ncbi:MAG: RluA family pseudouridine synthase [Bacilli bacterium]|nr:RluA family pseudouridine synthase [Bacilli bacterium]
MNRIVVDEANSNLRLDKFLSTHFAEFSRSHIAKLIDEENCFVNGKIAKASLKLKAGDEIEINIPEVKELEIEKEDIPLDIVYEDSDILIINKPQGMVVHPANGHYEHTLVNAILAHCNDLSGINGVMRPGIVHRIDKDTSGLICVAKNDKAHMSLADQLKDHTMSRTYVALTKGVIPENSGEINLPIGRDPRNRQKMAVTRTNSKEAITYFKVLERYCDHTLVECHLKTGRTHQIRVHLSYIGFPVEGDPLYSGRKYDTLYKNGQLLVAVGLKLVHPSTNKEMEFKIELPDYFKEVLSHLI